MAFHKEGTFPVRITKTCLAENRFLQPGQGFNVCLQVDDGNGQTGWWEGECSSRQVQNGNNAGKTWLEITRQTLQKLGIQSGDPTQHAVLVGVETTVEIGSSYSEKHGKTFYNVKYIGGGGGPKEIDQNSAAQMLAMMTGGQVQQPIQQPQQQMQQQPQQFGQPQQMQQQPQGGPNPFAQQP